MHAFLTVVFLLSTFSALKSLQDNICTCWGAVKGPPVKSDLNSSLGQTGNNNFQNAAACCFLYKITCLADFWKGTQRGAATFCTLPLTLRANSQGRARARTRAPDRTNQPTHFDTHTLEHTWSFELFFFLQPQTDCGLWDSFLGNLKRRYIFFCVC